MVTMTATVVAIMVLIAIREGINNNKTFKKKMRGVPIPGELMVVRLKTRRASNRGGGELNLHHRERETDIERLKDRNQDI